MTRINLADESGLTGQSSAMGRSEPYPVMFNPAFFTRRSVLVVGGGRVAERKVNTLLEAGAKIRLVAPQLTPGLAVLVSAGQLEWLARPWRSGDVRDYPAALLIFAATNDPAINTQVAAEARQEGRLVNRADLPEACDFTLPGVVRSGEITLAVSTAIYSNSGNSPEEKGGASPALTAHLRKKLAGVVGPEYSLLSALLRELRPEVKREVSPSRRPQLWKRMVESPALKLLRQGQEGEARQLLEDFIREESKEAKTLNEEIY